MSRRLTNALPLLLLALAPVATAEQASATEVWSGRTFSFTKLDGADWTLAENQDRITPNVWITRQNYQGIFNIAVEPGYVFGSPTGTEWATGNAVDHASLTFANWVTWAAGNPPGTVGVDAVVHLIADDIYCDIRIDDWTGPSGGGGFTYTRAVAPVGAVQPGVTAFSLRGFLSNPVRSDATVEFSLPDAAPAILEVLDVAGRRIARHDVGVLGAGVHRLAIPEVAALGPGLVFVRLARGDRALVTRGTRLR